MTINHFFRRPKTLAQLREGPLGPYIDLLAERLYNEGYSRCTGRQSIRAVAQFSRWLQKNRVSVEQVSGHHVQLYPRSQRSNVGPALHKVIHLVHPDPVKVETNCADTPLALLMSAFTRHIKEDMGLAVGTQKYYTRFANRFLNSQLSGISSKLIQLSAADIVAFIRSEVTRVPRTMARQMATALRCFLRFARYRGLVTTNLADAIPPVAHWRMASLPKYLSPTQVRLVLDGCDRRTAKGKRDFAILLLLARLGLRAGEVAALDLDSIDWHAGTVTVHGKGRRVSQFPLLEDVGAAIAAYIQNGRPRVASKVLFLRAVAPAKPLHGEAAISAIARTALERSHVNPPSKGAHIFRHTLATEMLRHGASLTEIGQILRHQSVDSTTVYAKVDLTSLRSIAPAWPGGAQ